LGLIQESVKLIIETEQEKKQNYESLFQGRPKRHNKIQNNSISSTHSNTNMAEGVEDQNNLDNLIEMINIKSKVDFCLQKLDPIINQKDDDDDS
jgi:DNA-binding MurR/RpiR family transcriptional regulator